MLIFARFHQQITDILILGRGRGNQQQPDVSEPMTDQTDDNNQNPKHKASLLKANREAEKTETKKEQVLIMHIAQLTHTSFKKEKDIFKLYILVVFTIV